MNTNQGLKEGWTWNSMIYKIRDALTIPNIGFSKCW